jgi:hypothetical protein
MVDTHVSGTCGRKPVGVQVPSSAIYLVLYYLWLSSLYPFLVRAFLLFSVMGLKHLKQLTNIPVFKPLN